MSAPYDLRRLEFRLHRFTRHSWVSERARAAWGPRIEAIRRAWFDILWQSVMRGVRRCAVVEVPPHELLALEAALAPSGLAVGMLETREEGAALLTDQIVIGTPSIVASLREAWAASDIRAIGGLLEYPPCCVALHHEVIKTYGLVDPTWPMAWSAHPGAGEARVLEIIGPPQTNALLRWLGVQATPHLPCSPSCIPSIALSERLTALGRALGSTEAMEWLEGMLAWPAEWSALHGIAEIKTPVLKTVTNTDATPHRYAVRYVGSRYPEEGAAGLHFPYRPPQHRRLITLVSGVKRP